MRLLITGVNGFLGQNLVAYLAREGGYTLYGIVRDKSRVPASLAAHLQEVLLLDSLDQLPELDAIIHLAGKAHDLKNVSRESDYWEVNYDLTVKLFDLFKRTPGISHFINISSIKAISDHSKDIISEEVKEAPLTVYGRSKLASDQYISEAMATLPVDKRAYILRPCMIHGPNNKGNLNVFYRFVKMGIPYPFGAYDNKRSFTSIENICFLIKKLLQAKIPSDTFIVADDEPMAISDLFRTIARELNKPVRIMRIPPGLINLVARIGDKIGLPLNTEKVGKITESYVVSNLKIREKLQVELPVTAVDGIRQTIKSFVKQ